MISICCAACFSLYYYYSIAKLVYNILTAEQDCLAIPHIPLQCPHVWYFEFKPTIKICHTINCIVHCKIRVCAFSVYSYSIFGIPNRSALDCVHCSKISYKFPLLCWKFLLLSWHYALCFPAPIMPRIMLA